MCGSLCGCGWDGERVIYKDSTHQYVLYNGVKKDINGCVVAIFVLALQFAVYISCFIGTTDELEGDKRMINVQVRYGKQCNVKDDVDPRYVCNPEVANYWYIALAAVMLALNLMKDVVGSLRAFAQIPGIWSKIWALVVFAEAILAALLAILMAAIAENGYAAISNCIGVLFIHELSDKAFVAFQLIQGDDKKEEAEDGGDDGGGCCAFCARLGKTSFLFFAMFGILVLSLMFAALIRDKQTNQIVDVYGEDYYEKSYDGGDFKWDAFWDSDWYAWEGPDAYDGNAGQSTTSTTGGGGQSTTSTTGGATTTSTTGVP
jgi:hypothetical protein